ncbi:hypothetical protein J2X06_001740 [Lysobacter niastensis]|uniref:Uncharacterized protein n=1 Tax=Lysobacter niastensis TaxID=380629 RepID=A0ABU1WA98_9GAMM|nr:hypothetical protein [Lysobacter niastensis]MDR7134556.1 hypothetical protein [Lysobacter niastensis]
MHKLLFSLLLSFAPFGAAAGPNTYACKILQIVEMSDDGRIVEHQGMWRSTLGETFTVNRNNGEMIGLPFGTDSWRGGVKILNRGGDGNSYKAIVLSGGPNVSAKYIHIAEYKDGFEKPFWGNGGDAVIFSGVCH